MSVCPLLPAQTKQLAWLEPHEQMARLRRMSEIDVLRYDADFESWAHDGQRPPGGEGWRTWLMMAGRGYGKTRAGAEWIARLATQRGPPVRIALVGATEDEVRKVMIEGPSGLLNAGDRRRGRASSRASAASPGRAAARLMSIRGRIPTGCAAPSIISPGATSSPNGSAARRPGTICK